MQKQAAPRRFPKLARWLTSIYLAYGLFVFFGSMSGNSHEWWPIFVFPIIWPFGFVCLILLDLIGNALISDGSPDWVYTFVDYMGAVFFVGLGSVWVWFLGRLFSMAATHLFPLEPDGKSQ
jgi:hypothetical protein